jgi:DNA-binding MarR family transcriptional regulator
MRKREDQLQRRVEELTERLLSDIQRVLDHVTEDEVFYAKLQVEILRFVAKRPGCDPSDLKRALRVTTAVLAEPLTKLVERGFLECRRDGFCNRYYRVSLTHAG